MFLIYDYLKPDKLTGIFVDQRERQCFLWGILIGVTFVAVMCYGIDWQFG